MRPKEAALIKVAKIKAAQEIASLILAKL